MERKLSKIGFFGLLIASSLTIMVGCALTPALPEIGAHYGLGANAGYLMTLPALGVVIGSIPGGKFLDKHGAYRTCVIGLILYGILGMTGCLMPGVVSELANRLLLGMATALVMTSSTALIALFYKGSELLEKIAIQGMAIELGGVIFLSISGQIAEISWRMPYMIYVIAFVALAFLLAFVPHVSEREKKNSAASKEEGTLATQEKSIPWILAFSFLGMLIFFTAIVSLPAYLQGGRGYSQSFTGLYLAGISLVAVVFARLMPEVVHAFSAKICLSIAFTCYFLAHALFAFTSSTLLLFVAALIMGIGFGFSTPLINGLTVERSSLKHRARNLSLYSMGTFLGQFASSFIASLTGSHVFFAAAILALVTFCLVAFFFDRQRPVSA